MVPRFSPRAAASSRVVGRREFVGREPPEISRSIASRTCSASGIGAVRSIPIWLRSNWPTIEPIVLPALSAWQALDGANQHLQISAVCTEQTACFQLIGINLQQLC